MIPLLVFAYLSLFSFSSASDYLESPTTCWSEDICTNRSSPMPTKPHEVFINGFIVMLTTSPGESKASLNMYIWIKWKQCALDFDGSLFRPDLSMIFRNVVERPGTFYSQQIFPSPLCLGDFFYQRWRVEGNFKQFFNFRKYPLDSHTIYVDVQDTFHPLDQLRYVVDPNVTNVVRKNISVRGWQITDASGETVDLEYFTNWGIGNDDSSNVSRFRLGVDISRGFMIFFFKILPPILIVEFTSILVFRINIRQISTRLGSSTGGLLTLMFLHLSFTSNLPSNLDYLTLQDWVFLVGYLIVIAVTAQTFLIHKYETMLKEKEEAEKLHLIETAEEQEQVSRIYEKIRKLDDFFFWTFTIGAIPAQALVTIIVLLSQ